MEPIDFKNLIRAGELSEQLKIHVHCLYRWYAEGRLRGYKLGRRLYFDRKDVQDMFETKEPPPRPGERRPQRTAAQARWTEETLARFGLRPDGTACPKPKESAS